VDEEWAKNEPWRTQRLEHIRQELERRKDGAERQWYVNGQGQTMVVIPGPVQFKMGSPHSERWRYPSEALHEQRIGRTFAFATKSVTIEQFRRFPQGQDSASRSLLGKPEKDESRPVGLLSWYRAVEYCNWLSDQEGISKDQWCFEPNPEGQYSQGMKLKPNYLSLTGYRLPTEAEWEYACRAGAQTSRFYGESEDLLRWYGVYSGTAGGRSLPVGSLKPNDFGLFDMHGNNSCWCMNIYRDYIVAPAGEVTDDDEDSQVVNNDSSRATRGDHRNNPARGVRAANRDSSAPSHGGAGQIGFRPVRTFR
jgi:formylglycine-generating enzyme required for sulfatase activity